jgi:hypothetical protein
VLSVAVLCAPVHHCHRTYRAHRHLSCISLLTTDSDTRVFNRASLQDAASIDSEQVQPADTLIDTQERGIGIVAFFCSFHAHRAYHTLRFSV